MSNLNRNGQKQSDKKSLTTFFVSKEEGQLKGRIFTRNDFAVFKLLFVS